MEFALTVGVLQLMELRHQGVIIHQLSVKRVGQPRVIFLVDEKE